MESTIGKVSIEQILKKLNKKQDCQIIDVREQHEYEKVHIKGAKLIPLSEFDQKYQSIDKNKPIYLHCGVGGRATKAAEFLLACGYKNLFVIDGGIKAWIEAGYPVECGW